MRGEFLQNTSNQSCDIYVVKREKDTMCLKKEKRYTVFNSLPKEFIFEAISKET